MNAAVTERGIVFTAVPAGAVAYVDRAQVPGSGVEALVVEPDGDLDDRAGRALSALLAPLRAVLEGLPGPLDVRGSGAVAEALRAERADAGDGRPAVVLDLTGEPDEIRAATASLADLGTLVLARDPVAPVDLDLYPDVHVRGLRIVGTGRPEAVVAGPEPAVDIPVVEAADGVPARADGAWYRVVGDGTGAG
jgi:hypothetical protein